MPQTETQTREEWLAGLKVGDEVALTDIFDGTVQIVPIKAETKTTWKVSEGSFSKRNGRPTGLGPWEQIAQASDAKRAAAYQHSLRLELQRLVDGNLDTYSTATLEAAIAVLKGESRDT